MEMIYFTVAAVVLYVVSDWILNQIEIKQEHDWKIDRWCFLLLSALYRLYLFISFKLFTQKQRHLPR